MENYNFPKVLMLSFGVVHVRRMKWTDM